MSRIWTTAALLLLSCTKTETPDTGPTLETGWFADTASPENCPGTISDIAPKAGATQWYWRDMPQVWTNNSRQETYQASLWQGSDPLDAQMVWADNGVTFQVVREQPFEPNTDYELELTDCRETQRVPFRTSEFGAPLDGEFEDLVGSTYLIDLAGATWLEPGGFSAILSLYFTTPILLMVSYADADHVDFLGAQGYRDDQGIYRQIPTEPTFEFPLAQWPQKPYFDAVSPQVEISFESVTISVYDFSLSGTFAADGSAIGGATLQGVGDTRYMGKLIGKEGEPQAICDQAATLGVSCIDCPDGMPYCMGLSAVDVGGTRVPGLQLVPMN